MHGRFIIGLHLGVGDVQVDFGGTQPGMPEQALDGGDRDARLSQVAAKGVAQLVAGNPQPGLLALTRQTFLDAGHAQPAAKAVEKYRLVLALRAHCQPHP